MRIIAILICSLSVAFSQSSIFVDVPYIAQGNNRSDAPFFLQPVGQSFRYQQVYGAQDFIRSVPEGGWITRFAVIHNGNPINDFVREIQIDFSTTSRAPDSLSPVFSENVGSDNLIVYDRGSLLMDNRGDLGEVFPYGTTISLSRPFFYNPADGNLLMDVRVYRAFDPFVPGIYFSAIQVTLGDAVSRLGAYDVDAEVARFIDTGGLATLFTVTPVPEPSTVVLLVIGLAGFGTLARKARKNSSPREKRDYVLN